MIVKMKPYLAIRRMIFRNSNPASQTLGKRWRAAKFLND
jgi:hypothetical protein